MFPVHRREFLMLLGALLDPTALFSGDWDRETPLATSIREALEAIFSGLSMALDFRCINRQHDEEFRIQINASNLYPVASCFKAFLVLDYFLNTPQSEWVYDESSTVYRTAVYSDNTATGVLLDEIGQRTPGRENAIEKFNNFIHTVIGLSSGLHTWNWPDTPVSGVRDPRFAPSETRQVVVDGQAYLVDNVFTAADLGRGYDFLMRGEYFTRSPVVRDAIHMTKTLLSIPAADYQSPIERVYSPGYTGKDGILPARDVATGRVVNDAGLIYMNERAYILAFLSAGESESTAISVLREVVGQMAVYEAGRHLDWQEENRILG
jgi:hypothetical protein